MKFLNDWTLLLVAIISSLAIWGGFEAYQAFNPDSVQTAVIQLRQITPAIDFTVVENLKNRTQPVSP